MLGTINKILKKLVGDKAAKDLKEVQPIIAKVHAAEAVLAQQSNDALRNATEQLRERIKQSITELEQRIADIKTKAEALPSEELEQKESLFAQVDKLEKEVDQQIETTLLEILPEAFAIVKETSKRWKENKQIEVTASEFDKTLAATGQKTYIQIQGDKAVWANRWNAAGTEIVWEMVHYDVQLIGGWALHTGKVAEMATGEGKTLVATLPVFLNALAGRGVHLVTVNDYLARRDSEWMGPLFEFHGMSVDCIDRHQPNSPARRAAYRADITYGTNNEFGFDYLRDNMATEANMLVQRKHHFAIVDEVDSVLIDEARTPLIISGPTPKGDVQEFDNLKPKVQELIDAQRAAANEFLTLAKKKLTVGSASKEELTEGGLALYRAHRGLPKNKALIKFLSEEGMKSALLKTEGTYLQDNSRDMHKVDAELYFAIDEKHNSVELTEKGIQLMSRNMQDERFFVMPDIGAVLAEIEQGQLTDEEKLQMKDALMQDYALKSDRIHTINQLLKAYALFEKDVDYVVIDNKVKIVDEQTGRIMEGRRYSDGLHQAIEAKEKVKVEAATQTYATITLQNYFRMYHKLAGMTGTAETEAGELWNIYKLDVMVIPTNRHISRKDQDDKIYKTKREKYNAVIDDVAELRAAGRPVLVGTTTVEVSELLSKMLKLRGIEHQVLNAKLHQREADIVALAGRAGTVTIATNMAGRGTDIKLGEGVKENGGLAIVGTERHDSRRVDRQLRGRAGRQGDPGSSQFYVSLEDDLMRLFGSDRIAKMMDRMGYKEGEVIQHSMITGSIERAQKKVEENNFGIRKRLLEYDDVMNAQREVIYKRRRHALFGERLKLDIDYMFADLSANVVTQHHVNKYFEGYQLDLLRLFGIESPVQEEEFLRSKTDDLIDKTYDAVLAKYHQRSAAMAAEAFPVLKNIFENNNQGFQNIAIPFSDNRRGMQVAVNLEKAYQSQGREVIHSLEKGITLALIDQNWKEHLRSMDDLRSNVQFASHEQKDPLLIYKLESYELFKNILAKVNGEICSFLMHAKLPQGDGQVQRAPAARPAEQSRLNVNKAESMNLQERQMATARMQQGQGPGAPMAPQVKAEPVRAEVRIGRNDPCPCGSGKKFKSCHGQGE
jgi:preprotein translocase subunit SecA